MFNTKSEFIKVIDNSHIINKIYAKQKENKPPKSSVWYWNSAHEICSCGSQCTIPGNTSKAFLLA